MHFTSEQQYKDEETTVPPSHADSGRGNDLSVINNTWSPFAD